MDKTEPDWQSGKSVLDCNRHMLEEQIDCDVNFLVGDQKTPVWAHKYMLKSRSYVFYLMFAPQFTSDSCDTIEIPDINVEIFKDLLKFIYCEETNLTRDNVLYMLYAAKKYQIKTLVQKCLKLVQKHLDPVNVCTVLETAHIYDDSVLKQKCFVVIKYKTSEVLKSNCLHELCIDCLASVIELDDISVNEEEVFEGVLEYAKKKCEQNGKEQTSENLQQVLGDCIKHVRFPLMTAEYFSEVVEPSGILTEAHTLKLLGYFVRRKSGKDTVCEGFNDKPRRCWLVAERFTEVASGWQYKRDKPDAVTFESSREIMLKGFQIYGCCQGADNLKFRYTLWQEPYGGIVLDKTVSLQCDGIQKVYDVYFDEPKKILGEKKFTISVVITGPTTFFGDKGVEKLEMDSVTIKFSNSLSSINRTTISEGQIPGLIYGFCL